jgi:hypothetical protein
MSRRTHLLVIASALLLIVVPTMYVWLTWTVQDPLSFRLQGYGEPVRTQDGFNERAYELPFYIEVRNTSAVAIQIYELRVRSASRPVIPRGRFAHQGLVSGFSSIVYTPDRPLLIGAHDSATVVYISSGNTPGVLTSIDPEMAYAHSTRTQERLTYWLSLVRARCPPSMHEYFPTFDEDKGSAPLVIPDPLPASPPPKI